MGSFAVIIVINGVHSMNKILDSLGLLCLIIGLLYLVMYLFTLEEFYSMKSMIVILAGLLSQKIDQLKEAK